MRSRSFNSNTNEFCQELLRFAKREDQFQIRFPPHGDDKNEIRFCRPPGNYDLLVVPFCRSVSS